MPGAVRIMEHPVGMLAVQVTVRIYHFRLYPDTEIQSQSETLRAEFPEVWFENCAGGGGRVDLGMMARTDFCWASDNTDPVERTFIQYSFLNAFPSNSMISWVTQEDWHNQRHPLEFKFDVSLCGVLGVGYRYGIIRIFRQIIHKHN